MPVDNVEAKNLLISEKAFTDGRMPEKTIWIPLDMEVSKEDRDEIHYI